MKYMYVLSTIFAGYCRVHSRLVKITDSLKAVKGARGILTLHYKQEQWLDDNEYPTEFELVTIALNRIKTDSSQYDIFLTMLRDIRGLDLIVNAITCGPGKFLLMHGTVG